jgi:hypothetical protein
MLQFQYIVAKQEGTSWTKRRTLACKTYPSEGLGKAFISLDKGMGERYDGFKIFAAFIVEGIKYVI